MTWAMDYAPEELTSTQRHVLLVLADYVNDETHSAYPSVASLASRTGLSTRAVRQALRVLEAYEIIETRIKSATGSGERPIPADRRPNLYRWIATDLERAERHSPRKWNERNVVQGRAERGSPRERNVVPPNPYKNHKKNSSYSDDLETGAVLEFDTRAVLEAIREKFPDAPSWLAEKSVPALRAGWLPYEIATEISKESVENARSVSAILSARLAEVGTRSPKRKPVKPKWCGNCDETTRLVEVEDAIGRCSKCHPLTIGSVV